MHVPIILIILLIFNTLTVYKFLFKLIFNDVDDFKESLRYSFTPNIISLFKGEYWKDHVAEFKLGFFILLCVIITAIEFAIVNGILQSVISI